MSDSTRNLENILAMVQEVLEEVYIFCYILNVEPELPLEPDIKDLTTDEKALSFIISNLADCKRQLVKCEDQLRVIREDTNGDSY